MIYHIAQQLEWNDQIKINSYAPSRLAVEGFIHCSFKEQLPGVISRYYAGVTNLVLLHIEEGKLESELKYELSSNQELFPHVFGRINKSAILFIEKIA